MNTRLILTLVAGSALMGCHKQEPASPPPTVQQSAPAPAPETAKPAAEAIPAPPPEPGAEPVAAAPDAATTSEPASTAITPTTKSPELIMLNKALSKYWVDQGSPPPNLEDLVRRKYISGIPKAPSGKKFFYNMSRMEITEADK